MTCQEEHYRRNLRELSTAASVSTGELLSAAVIMFRDIAVCVCVRV